MKPATALALLLLASAPLQATPESRTSVTTSSLATLTRESLEQAKIWGLSEQEWSRFREIQAGPRGYWSPGLDPLTTLGVEARSDAERQRYAELQVRLEAQRAERELAYQNAYADAWARLYPGQLPIQGLSDVPRASPATPRLALFAASDCAACLKRVRQLQASDTPFDLYLIDSQSDDQRIRDWARQAGLEPERVQRRQITLNHGQEPWARLDSQGTLPASFRQVNGQWQRLD